MNSKTIRDKIQKALSKEKRSHAAAKRLDQHVATTGVSMTPQQKVDCLGFIQAYVSETPDIMDAVYGAAQNAGVLGSVQPVFDAAFQYWGEAHDYIPDRLGLFGLADDAYLTRMLMESISNLHHQRTGNPLFSADLGPANRVMRGLIGDPLATRLDAVVGQTVAAQAIQAGLQALAGMGAGFGFGMPNLGGTSQYELDRQVDVQLGAMGVV